jgi:hypothetical protein
MTRMSEAKKKRNIYGPEFNGTALLMQCEDAEIAEMIAIRKETAGLCLRAGERHFVVRPEHEEKFRALVRALGLGMAI